MTDAGSKDTGGRSTMSAAGSVSATQQVPASPPNHSATSTVPQVHSSLDPKPIKPSVTAADLRVAPTPLPWFRHRLVRWIGIIIVIVIGAVLLARQDISLTLWTDENADSTAIIERWEKLSGIAQNLVTIIAIILGGFWTYFTFIKGRTLKEQLEPKVTSHIINRSNDKILVATIQLKNTGKTIVNFKQSGTRLVVFQYQPSENIAVVTENEWHVYYAAPPILRDHERIEPGEQIQEPVLIPLEQDDRQIYMIRLRINSKKTTWTVDAIIEGNSATSKPLNSATSQNGEE